MDFFVRFRQNSLNTLLKEIRRITKSVRFRLSLWYTLTFGLVLTVFGGGVYLILDKNVHSNLDDLLYSRSAQLLNNLNVKTTNSGQTEVLHLPIAQDSQAQAAGEVWLLLNNQAQVVEQLGNFTPIDLQMLSRQAVQQDVTTSNYSHSSTFYQNYEFSVKTVSGKTIQLDYRFCFYPIVNSTTNQFEGVLVLGQSREGIEKTLHELLLLLVLAIPLILLLSAVVGYLLATRAMRPVQTITHAAQRISETDLSLRLELATQDEIGELTTTFNNMLQRLEEAFERQRQFTADASHELRTPLTIVKLETDQLLEEYALPTEAQLALQTVQNETAHMTRLVEDLLMLARADTGQLKLGLETLDLSDLALEAVERLELLARNEKVSLLTGELPELTLQGDRFYLLQMLSNLVENAIKYSRVSGTSASKWVKIETGILDQALREAENWAWVRISDNGPGIAEEHLPYLFDRFYRVDAARTSFRPTTSFDHNNSPTNKSSATTLSTIQNEASLSAKKGSGLGLTIVKWIVDAHLGKIKITSNTDPAHSGTCVEIWLPLSKV